MINVNSINSKKVFNFFTSYSFYLIFLILIITYTIINPFFLSIQNIFSILNQASPLLILGTGLTIVILMGGIDLSVGSIAGVAAAICARLINRGMNPILVICLTPLIGIVIGSINGFLITKLKINPFLTTLSMLFILKGAMLHLVFGGVVPVTNKILSSIGTGYIGGVFPITIIIFLVFIIGGQILVRFTSFGRNILAIGLNEVAARQAGVLINKTKFIAYIVCGFCASFAGLIWASRFGGANNNIGVGVEFIGVAIVVLGGTRLSGGEGSIIPGTLIGALLLLSIENGLVLMKANIYIYPLVRGAVLFLAVFVDSLKNKK